MLPTAHARGTTHARHPTTRLIRLAQQAVGFIHHQILQMLQREPGRALHMRDQTAACRGGRERWLAATQQPQCMLGTHRPGVMTSTSMQLDAPAPTSAAASACSGPLPEATATSRPTAVHKG
jgi:hypothetical protein